MRGEHASTSVRLAALGGPSPRARGTHRPLPARAPRRRSIPACAGNTSRFASRRSTVFGPSPRARGTPRAGLQDGGAGRSIPACAGNTAQARSMALRNAVHPRVRGEHLSWFAPGAAASRSIPACAGNTIGSCHRRYLPSVHPRVRGEHSGGLMRRTGCRGPSPRARGTLAPAARSRRMSRSIPACAGNTDRRVQSTASTAVHPRVRGEHRTGCRFTASPAGPSPRARGTRHPRGRG